MKSRRIAVPLAVAGLALLTGACSSSSGPSGQSCNLVASTSSLGNVDIAVHYSVTKTGDGTVQSVTYGTNGGQVVLHNPTVPWEMDVDLSGGVQASLSAVGHINTGSILAEYNALAGDASEMEQDSCGGSDK